jgi:hypothetical protein
LFSLGPPVSSTNKTDGHDITEILLKVVLNTIKQANNKHNLFNKANVSLNIEINVDRRFCIDSKINVRE